MPLEVRLWRFIAIEPVPPGAIRAPASPVGMLLVVFDRGRAADAASLGRPDPPLREGPLGAPDARFLQVQSEKPSVRNKSSKTHRFLITSVLRDNGRTTP